MAYVYYVRQIFQRGKNENVNKSILCLVCFIHYIFSVCSYNIKNVELTNVNFLKRQQVILLTFFFMQFCH